MKHILTTFFLFLSLISGVIFLSCSKDTDDKNSCLISGTVIGFNHDKCGCCPGWIIKSGSDTLKFLNIPDDEGLNDLVDFYGYPIPIKFNYKDDTSLCADYYKIMTCINFDLELNCSRDGLIIDYNSTECGCCPGWIIKVGQDTIKVLNLPNENQVKSLIDSKGFPVSVKLDYDNITGSCQDFYKKITCMTFKY